MAPASTSRGEIHLAIKSAFTKSLQPANFGRNSTANVVFPAPFGPAITKTIGWLDILRSLFRFAIRCITRVNATWLSYYPRPKQEIKKRFLPGITQPQGHGAERFRKPGRDGEPHLAGPPFDRDFCAGRRNPSGRDPLPDAVNPVRTPGRPVQVGAPAEMKVKRVPAARRQVMVFFHLQSPPAYSIVFSAVGFRSGQTGQTVNLLALPSKVRILPLPLSFWAGFLSCSP